MARDRVTFVGEIVAAVLASDRYLAEDAAELVRVEYEPLAVMVDPETALGPTAWRCAMTCPTTWLPS